MLIKYSGWYVVFLIFIILFVDGLVWGFNVDIGSGVGLPAVMATSWIVGNSFVGQERRLMLGYETSSLIWLCLGATLLLVNVNTFVTRHLFLSADLLAKLPQPTLTLMIVGFVLEFIIYFYLISRFLKLGMRHAARRVAGA